MTVRLFHTIDRLLELGFERSTTRPDEVRYRLEHVRLEGIPAQDRFFRDIVYLTGDARSKRSMASIALDLPPRLGTKLEAAAWITYVLRDYKDAFVPLPDWFTEGEQAWDLIPHVRRDREEEKQRQAWLKARREAPQCSIDREEARLLRKRIRRSLCELDGASDLTAAFDGRVLSIRVGADVHQVVASGDQWASAYRTRASAETKLPDRFNEPWVSVMVFEGDLLMNEISIGRCEATP